MANYYYNSRVHSKSNTWEIFLLGPEDGYGYPPVKAKWQFPSFTTDKLSGQLMPDPTFIDSGIMKNTDDTEGLQKYLRDGGYIGADDVLLPWSDDNEYSETQKAAYQHGNRIARAKQSDLVLLPENITGTNCFNCRFVEVTEGKGYCNNPKVLQDVTARMCCCYWDAEGTKRIADMLISGEDILAKGGQAKSEYDFFKSNVDRKGNPKKPWMYTLSQRFEIERNVHGNYPYLLRDNLTGKGVGNNPAKPYSYFYKTTEAADKQAFKSFKKEIQEAIGDNSFAQDIAGGLITKEDAAAIIESGKMQVPDFSHGGISDQKFDEIVEKVSGQYEGKPVKKKYQKKYGKKYSAREAKSVGYAVANTIDKKAGKKEDGGSVDPLYNEIAALKDRIEKETGLKITIRKGTGSMKGYLRFMPVKKGDTYPLFPFEYSQKLQQEMPGQEPRPNFFTTSDYFVYYGPALHNISKLPNKTFIPHKKKEPKARQWGSKNSQVRLDKAARRFGKKQRDRGQSFF